MKTLRFGDPVRVRVGPAILELVQGDITRQPGIDAIVNAANAELRPGGGVAGAIHRAAGPALADAAAAYAPIRPGQSVITAGYALPNQCVIHCLGPVYGRDEPAEVLLSACYSTALTLADSRGLESVAFPALATGAFGYPMGEAAEIALRTVLAVVPTLKAVRHVRFVLWDSESVDIHRGTLDRLMNPPAA